MDLLKLLFLFEKGFPSFKNWSRILRLPLLIFLSIPLFSNAQVVINEIYPNGTVELKNIGTSTVDISDYWLCDFPAYQQISRSNIICGDAVLEAGEILTVDNFNTIANDNGEMGLYTTNSFGDENAIIDYVEWGRTGHGRSAVAVRAGLWTTGAFVPSFGPNTSLAYDGEGNNVSDWSIASTPTICEENVASSDCDVDGGRITLDNGETSTSICVDGVGDPLNINVDGSQGSNRAWIITDNQDNILALPDAPPFDLDGAGAGTCFIWYMRYEDGLTGLEGGNNLSDLEGCFDLSNGVEVVREVPDGGTVTLLDGSNTYIGNAGDIVFQVQHTTTAPNLSYWYIITDNEDSILGWLNSSDGNTLDLSGAPVGVCRIWGWNYRGLGDPIVGDNIATLMDDSCEDVSDEFITVIRESNCPDVSGGMITLDNGETSTSICVDGVGDPLNINVEGSQGPKFAWIITDDLNNVLALPDAPPFDLDGAGAGTCRIWYLRYDNNIEGLNEGANLADLEGCFDISNFVEVIREIPDGGTVTLLDGSTSYAQCAGDIVFEVTHTTTAPNLSYWYIITDNQDNILGWLNSADGNTLDLSGAPAGTCRIWGWNYRGLGDPVVGDNISTLMDDFCEDVSDEFITVYREVPDGGAVTLLDGSTTYTGTAGNIVFQVQHTTTAPNLSYWYIITDDQDNILGWLNSADGNTLDLSGAPAGTCRIWGWNYRGLGDPIMGDNISTLSDDFYEDVSDEFITVIRESDCDVDGGMIALDNGETSTSICVDGVGDPLHVNVENSQGTNRAWIITDDQDNILALPDAPPFDLDGAGAGTCFIWYMRYEDGLTGLEGGNNLSDLEGCFDLSNAVEVIREVPDGGVVTLLDGSTSYAQCAGDIVFEVTHTTTAPNLSYWYIITDDQDNILGWLNSADGNTLDLSGAPAGTCRIWGWNYRGLGDPIVGDNISTLMDDSCEDVSDEFITVYREVPDGGTVSLLDGSNTYVGNAGNIVFQVQHTTTAPNLSYWYIITDDQDNILGWLNSADGNTLDLSGAPVGVCRIWGWNYRGLGDPIVGDNIATLSDDFCEDVSDEFITVIRESDCPDVSGGMITLDNGETSTSICVDGVGDPLNINVEGSQGPKFAWIITDDQNNVLGLPDAPPFDLDGAGAGTCRIWYLRYDNNIEGLTEGANLADLEGCFDISNFVEVIREIPDGGTVTLLDGSTTYTGTAGNIVFDVTHTTTAPNLSYWYIITDDQDNILGWLNSADGNTLDLSGAPAGECHIWGWNYRGLGDPVVGDNIATLMDDSCEDISDNFITLIRREGNVEGGDLNLEVTVNNLLYRQYSRVTYRVSITNEGTEDMTQVAVNTPFPEGMRFAGVDPSKGNYRQVRQEWKVRNLAAGETAYLDLTLFTLIGGEEIEFFAEVSNALEEDVDSTPNNGANGEDDEASITIMPLENGGFGSTEGNTDLELSISADVDAYTIYEPVTFFIELTNNGDDRAETILVDAGLPEGLVFTSANATHGRYRLFMEQWYVQSLEVGETATLELTLFPLVTGQEITNFVEVHTVLQVDMDSTPANGDGVTAQEDDEAVITLNSTIRNNSAANITVDPRSFEGTSVVVDQIYPNPTAERVNLELVSIETADTEVQIVNQYGQVVQTVPTQIERGHNKLQLDVTNLPTGNYYLIIRGLEGYNITRPFVKVR